MEIKNENRLKIILLVEDEETLRRSISFTLVRHGHTVHPCSSVDDAMLFVNGAAALHLEIVLIVTDLQLPGKNGLELIREIRRQEKEIPVLVITGHGSREVRKELELLGVTQVLDKPFDLEELVMKVRSMIDMRERSR